jgi:hypothetical protein
MTKMIVELEEALKRILPLTIEEKAFLLIFVVFTAFARYLNIDYNINKWNPERYPVPKVPVYVSSV